MMHVRRPVGRLVGLSSFGLRRPMAALTAVLTAVGAVTFVAQPSWAAEPVAAVPAPAPAEAAEEATAMQLAWKSRKPVEILAERTESSDTFALPDGTLRSRQYVAPVRVRRGAG